MALRINVDANLLCSAGNAMVSISPLIKLSFHLNVWFVSIAGVVSKSETITFDAMWDKPDYCGDCNRLKRSEVFCIWAGFQSSRSSQNIEAMKTVVMWKPGFSDRPSVKCQYPFKYRFSLVYRRSQTPVTFFLKQDTIPLSNPVKLHSQRISKPRLRW